MSTHNIGFYEDLTKLSLYYHQISSNMHLISSAVNNFVVRLWHGQVFPIIFIMCCIYIISLILLLAVVPRSHGHNLPVPLIQEELVFSYWQKNGHLILVNCLQEACPGSVWLCN